MENCLMINGKQIRANLNQYKFSPRTMEEMYRLFDGLVEY